MSISTTNVEYSTNLNDLNPLNAAEMLHTKSKRDISGLSDSALRGIDLVTLSDQVFPVGSYQYRSHSYPSDVDLMEYTHTCCSKTSVSPKVMREFKKMFDKINKDPQAHLSDFKAGYINDYDLVEPNLGEFNALTDKLEGYNSRNVVQYINKLRDDGKISTEDAQKALAVSSAGSKMNLMQYLKLLEYIKKFTVIRWNMTELLKAKKTLDNGETVLLKNAMASGSMVKIDIFYPINGNYREVTNVFAITTTDSSGKKTMLSKPFGDYNRAMALEVAKYAPDTLDKPLKMAKRLWMKTLRQPSTPSNVKIINGLTPLFSSGIAQLNQIAEEIIVLQEMARIGLNKKDKDIVSMQVDRFKPRINMINDIVGLQYKVYFSLLDNIKIDNPRSYDSILLKLKTDVSWYTKKYLKATGLF